LIGELNMATVEVPKEVEVQRFIIAIIFILGFFTLTGIAFYSLYIVDKTTAINFIKDILLVISGWVGAVVTFFFATKALGR